MNDVEFENEIDNSKILIILKMYHCCIRDDCYNCRLLTYGCSCGLTCEHLTNRERVRHSKKHNFQISTIFKVFPYHVTLTQTLSDNGIIRRVEICK